MYKYLTGYYGNDVLACGTMNSFINIVDRLEDRGRLTMAQADDLIIQTEAIKDALGCFRSSSMQAADEGATGTSVPLLQSSASQGNTPSFF